MGRTIKDYTIVHVPYCECVNRKQVLHTIHTLSSENIWFVVCAKRDIKCEISQLFYLFNLRRCSKRYNNDIDKENMNIAQ